MINKTKFMTSYETNVKIEIDNIQVEKVEEYKTLDKPLQQKTEQRTKHNPE